MSLGHPSVGGGTSFEPPKRTPLWRWILARTDWLAVISCIPLSAGLVLYCVPVSQAHGDTQELLRIASGGQSSLSWLATVYAVTLGITLPLSIIGILYSLLVVAGSIYAHRHMYPDSSSEGGRQKQAQPVHAPAPAPVQQARPLPQHAATMPSSAALWRGELPPEPPASQRVPSTGSLHGWAGSSQDGSTGPSPARRQPSPVRQPSPAASVRKVASLPLATPAAAAGGAVPDLAHALKGDKRQAAGLWERALGLSRVGGMQSVLGMLAGREAPGPLGAKPPGPREAVVVDLTKLKSPIHRRLPSMSVAMALRHGMGAGGEGAASAAAGGLGAAAAAGGGGGAAAGRRAPPLPCRSGAGAGGAGAQPQLGRLISDDSALSHSDVEIDMPSGAPAEGLEAGRRSRNGAAARLRWGKAAAAVAVVRRSLAPALWLARWRRARRQENDEEEGLEAAAGGSPAGSPRGGKAGGANGEQQGASYRAYRALKWMLLTLIAANSATLVWLVILLIATGAWLVCTQAVEGVARDVLALSSSTAMGAYGAGLGLAQQNQAAVSTFAQLFGQAFLSQVNQATGGKYSFTSYQQLQEVAGEDPALLGSAATSSYGSTAADGGVADLVAPQFGSSGSVSDNGGVVLPCPPTCLNFRYFSFLESGACVCDPASIQRVASLAGSTVNELAISLAGLALMFFAMLVLLLRFATHRGQVKTRWALRPALQLYASHREETLLRRHWRGRPLAAPTYSW